MAKTASDKTLIELKDTINRLNATIDVLTKTLEEERQSKKVLQEQLDYMTKKLFGRSSEKHATEIAGQYHLFDEAETEQRDDAPELILSEVKAHTRKSKSTKKERYRNLKEEEVIIPLSDDQKICPECGTELEYIGKEYVRSELIYIPAVLKVIKYYTETYECPKCKETESPVFIKSKAPEALIPHSDVSSSCVAWTAYQKYVNAIPLYRQEKDWAMYGLEVTRATLAKWIIMASTDYFKPLYDYWHRQLIKREFLMADETRVQVLKEPDRPPTSDSFMWLYRTGEDGLPAIQLYNYTPTRQGANAADFLKGAKGYLMSDGYRGYNKVTNLKRCSCWAHMRRYFVDAIPKGKDADLSEPAVQGVAYCDKLFSFERKYKAAGYTHEQRYEARLKDEKPVIEAFFKWVTTQHTLKNSRLYKALTYAQNAEPMLRTYLEDGRCSLSNNLSENAIRPFTVGRKNWLFSDSVKGAEGSAIVYTITEMARLHGLNTYMYLKFLLDQRPNKDMTDEQFEAISPWNENVKERMGL